MQKLEIYVDVAPIPNTNLSSFLFECRIIYWPTQAELIITYCIIDSSLKVCVRFVFVVILFMWVHWKEGLDLVLA